MKKSLILLTALVALMALGFAVPNTHAEGAVSGTVIDADGNAVAGARVAIKGEMVRGQRRPYMARTETNDEGGFGFRQVPAGNYVVTAITRELGGDREAIEVRDDEITEVELQLPGGGDDNGVGVVGGLVIDQDENLVESAWVMLIPARMMNERRGRHVRVLSTTTDADGVFRFEDVPAGNYVVMAMARGVGIDREAVEVVADGAVRVILQLQFPGGRHGKGRLDE
jgi:hypothetical protein